AATNTYVNSPGAVALLFAEMGNAATARAELARIPAALAAPIGLALAQTPALAAHRDAVGLCVPSRGGHYPPGSDVALQTRALSGLGTQGNAAADRLAGPLGSVQTECPDVVAAPSGPARPSDEAIVTPLRARGARIVAASDVRAVLRRAQTKIVL